jgi:hypothetical protein
MADKIERFNVPTLAQLEPLRSNTTGDDELTAVVGVLQAWQDNEKTHEEALQECSKILGMHDVVSLDIEGARHYTDEGIRMCPPFSYCNAGDTYITTLARDHEAGAWVVACWGDLAEEYERENELGDFETFEEAPDMCPSCGKRVPFKLESFQRGEWEGGRFVTSGTGYSFVCSSCNHSCQTAEDFTPPEDEEEEDDGEEGMPEDIIPEEP